MSWRQFSLFFYRPCGFSGFGRSLGGISGSLTGALGDGILLKQPRPSRSWKRQM